MTASHARQGHALGRVCVVDDNPEFLKTTVWWLEALGYVVKAFDDPFACLAAFEADARLRARTCLLVDVRMPQMTGLQLLESLRAQGGEQPVIFMSGHGDVPLAVEAMRKGAITFLEKPFQEATLEEALRAAFATAPTRTGGLPATNEAAAEFQRRLSLLSPREYEIFKLLTNGKTSKMIAKHLELSSKTIDMYRTRIFQKMKVNSLVKLARAAASGEVQED